MFDWPLLVKAAAVAARLHGSQTRKGTRIPYISHLLAVAALVLEHGGDEEQAAAALLHDVIEDCGKEHEAEITECFGARVIEIIRDCTDAETLPKPPWRPRKEAYLLHLRTIGEDAMLVSACDKLHNARTIVADLRAVGPQMMERFTGRAEGTLWFYRALMEVYHERLRNVRLLAELALEVDRMHRLTRTTEANPSAAR